MRRLFVLLIVTAACQRKPGVPNCDGMADHVLAMFVQGNAEADQFAREVRNVFAARCREDRWPDAMRSCVGQTSAVVTPQNCKQKLSPDQIKKLDADLKVVQDADGRRRLPVSCERYEKVLKEALTCDKLSKEMRDALAIKLAQAKSEWAALPDKRELAGVCAGAIQALKSAALDCPGSAKW